MFLRRLCRRRGLGATRMVYSSATSQAMMQVRNTHPDATFLIQSWMENEKGERTNDFAITPPLYVIKPASESAVKIMFNGKALPADRETLYWMTVKAIPQQAKSGAGNTLQFARLTASRSFIARRDSARARRGVEKTGRCLPRGKSHAQQPTPYYLTTINVKIDGMPVQPVMVPPKGSVTLPKPSAMRAAWSYQTINDYGAWTPATRARRYPNKKKQ